MILGREQHIHAACFEEIDTAVTLERGSGSTVYFNAHAFPDLLPEPADLPRGTRGVVYNLENVGIQIPPTLWPEHEIWDFSERNMDAWERAGRKVTYVPIGYHTSMERFQPLPWKDRDIDVVFAGSMNARRLEVLHEMKTRGLNVFHVTVYGQERDEALARAKLGLNMLYYEGGTFPALRVAHLIANQIPVISENCGESWDFLEEQCPVGGLAMFAEMLIQKTESDLQEIAMKNLQAFRSMPLTLPAFRGTSSEQP